MKFTWALSIVLTVAGTAAAADDPVIFKSDVALARVDAQVLDRSNRPITNLSAQDFILTVNGNPQEIKNFAREDMPADVVLLFDVSASMRPHVERIAFAGRQSLNALGERDRVAIMVFDRHTRVRMEFKNDLNEVDRQLRVMLDQERFNGGTDITQALYYAAGYIRQNGRRDARRFVVILTDDETEKDRDDAGVIRAMDDAGAVLSFLQAPDAMSYRNRGGYGGQYPGGGGQYPGSGGGQYPGGGGQHPGGGYPGGGYPGTSLPDIIFGRRYPSGGGYPRGGGQYPGGGGYGHTHSAGTAEIAQRTGGDTIPVDDAAALETTLSRLRQRYTLNFYLPGQSGQNPRILLALANSTSRRNPDAELRYRRVNLNDGDGTENAGNRSSDNPVIVSRGKGGGGGYDRPPMSDEDPVNKRIPDRRRRPGVSDGSSGRPLNTDDNYSSDDNRAAQQSNQGGWRRTTGPDTQTTLPQDRQAPPSDQKAAPADKQAAPQGVPNKAPKDPNDNSDRGGWRKAKPGEQE